MQKRLKSWKNYLSAVLLKELRNSLLPYFMSHKQGERRICKSKMAFLSQNLKQKICTCRDDYATHPGI